MGSIAERQLEDLRTVRCCMHISGSERFSGSTTDYRFIRLGQSENGLAPGRKNTFLESDAAVRSWAILLNIYTGLEVTSFVTFTSAPSSDVHNESSPTASGGVSPGGRLACCRLKDRSLLRDIHVNQAQSYDRADSARWSVNTAVQCFIAPGTGSADYDDRNVLPVGVHTENHEHVSITSSQSL